MKHIINHTLCGKPAMLYNIEPVAGEKIQVMHASHLGGRPYGPTERAVCDSCGRPLTAAHIYPGLNVYDMANKKDMEEIYETRNRA